MSGADESRLSSIQKVSAATRFREQAGRRSPARGRYASPFKVM
jgi:hypothetical protein